MSHLYKNQDLHLLVEKRHCPKQDMKSQWNSPEGDALRDWQVSLEKRSLMD